MREYLAQIVELWDAVVLQLWCSCGAVVVQLCCNCVAVVLQCVAVSSDDVSRRESLWRKLLTCVMQCVAVVLQLWCSALQCVAVVLHLCYSVLQCHPRMSHCERVFGASR